jgi:hypothetical protein
MSCELCDANNLACDQACKTENAASLQMIPDSNAASIPHVLSAMAFFFLASTISLAIKHRSSLSR